MKEESAGGAGALPWVEKYRPRRIEDVCGHGLIIRTITRFLSAGQLPHLLLYGPPGTGKTSLVQALARMLYDKRIRHMVLELNASDDRGIGTVRGQIRTFAETHAPTVTATAPPRESLLGSADAAPPPPKPPAHPPGSLHSFFKPVGKSAVGKKEGEGSAGAAATAAPSSSEPAGAALKPEPAVAVNPEPGPAETAVEERIGLEIHPSLKTLKLVVLDECDQMTAAAQTALRRIMEKYAATVRFILMCNDVSKINPPIQSRCSKFRLPPLSREHMLEKLDQVAQNEGVQMADDARQFLVQEANGDMRMVMNMLQACCLAKRTARPIQVGRQDIISALGVADPTELEAMLARMGHSISIRDALRQLVEHVNVAAAGFSITEVVTFLFRSLVASRRLDDRVMIDTVPRLADIELALAKGANPNIQLAALATVIAEISS